MNPRDWNRFNHDPRETGLTAAQIATGAILGTAGRYAVGAIFGTPKRTGQTRSGGHFRGDEQPSAPKKRRISTGPHSTTSSPGDSSSKTTTTMSKRGAHNDDEVDVVPPPKRISKSYPDYMTINLPFMERIALVSTTNALGAHSFRLNSVFDPNKTGVGHQPQGRDKFSTFGYQYYRVLSTECTFTFLQGTANVADDHNRHSICGFELTDDDSNTFSDFRAFVEAKNTKTDLIMSANYSWGGTSQQAVQTLSYSPDTWDHHVTEAGIEERWTPMGADPSISHLVVLHAGPAVIGGAYNTNTIVYVHLNYTVQFRENTVSYSVDSGS